MALLNLRAKLQSQDTFGTKPLWYARTSEFRGKKGEAQARTHKNNSSSPRPSDLTHHSWSCLRNLRVIVKGRCKMPVRHGAV